MNLERKSYLDCSSNTLCTRENLERWHNGCRHWGVRKSTQKRLNAKEVTFHNGFNFIRAKQNFSGDGKEFTKVSRAVGKAESHLHWQFIGVGTSCEDLSWNHRTAALHRSETNGIAEWAVRRIKERTSAELLHSGLDEKWWAHLWNAVDICETFKTSWQMWKLLMKGDLENHIKDLWYPLAPWENTTPFLRKTSQGSINLVRKFYLEYHLRQNDYRNAWCRFNLFSN